MSQPEPIESDPRGLCPTCGGRVTVSQSAEGTGCFVPEAQADTRRLCPHECPAPMCLLCGRSESCGLLDPSGTSEVCMFDATYAGLVEILHARDAEIGRLMARVTEAESLSTEGYGFSIIARSQRITEEQLRKELAEAQADTRRLDWLDSTRSGERGFYVWSDGVIACGANDGKPFREALDAAMAAEGGG